MLTCNLLLQGSHREKRAVGPRSRSAVNIEGCGFNRSAYLCVLMDAMGWLDEPQGVDRIHLSLSGVDPSGLRLM